MFRTNAPPKTQVLLRPDSNAPRIPKPKLRRGSEGGCVYSLSSSGEVFAVSTRGLAHADVIHAEVMTPVAMHMLEGKAPTEVMADIAILEGTLNPLLLPVIHEVNESGRSKLPLKTLLPRIVEQQRMLFNFARRGEGGTDLPAVSFMMSCLEEVVVRMCTLNVDPWSPFALAPATLTHQLAIVDSTVTCCRAQLSKTVVTTCTGGVIVAYLTPPLFACLDAIAYDVQHGASASSLDCHVLTAKHLVSHLPRVLATIEQLQTKIDCEGVERVRTAAAEFILAPATALETLRTRTQLPTEIVITNAELADGTLYYVLDWALSHAVRVIIFGCSALQPQRMVWGALPHDAFARLLSHVRTHTKEPEEVIVTVSSTRYAPMLNPAFGDTPLLYWLGDAAPHQCTLSDRLPLNSGLTRDHPRPTPPLYGGWVQMFTYNPSWSAAAVHARVDAVFRVACEVCPSTAGRRTLISYFYTQDTAQDVEAHVKKHNKISGGSSPHVSMYSAQQHGFVRTSHKSDANALERGYHAAFLGVPPVRSHQTVVVVPSVPAPAAWGVHLRAVIDRTHGAVFIVCPTNVGWDRLTLIDS